MTRKDRLVKDFLYTVLYQILLVLIPLITTPYLSRVLGYNGIGIYSYTYAIVSYFVIFSVFGTDFYGQKEIAYVQEDETKRSILFWEIFLLRLFMSVGSFAVFWLLFCTGENKEIFKIQSLHILVVAVDVTWLFGGMENFKKIVLRNSLIKIFNLLCIFLFVKTKQDVWRYCSIQGLVLMVGYLSLWKSINHYIVKIKFCEIKPFKQFKKVVRFFLPSLTIQLFTIVDKTMLGLYSKDFISNGYYEQAQRIMNLSLALVVSIITVMIPRISNLSSKGEHKKIITYMYKSYNIVFLLGIPLAAGMVIGAPIYIRWFLGIAGEQIINLVQVFSCLIIILGINQVTGDQYMLIRGLEKKYTLTVLFGFLINIMLNVILIPDLFALGATLASVISQLFILMMQFWIIREEISFKQMIRNAWKYFVACAAMSVVLFIIRNYSSPTFAGTLSLVGVGGVTYAVSLLILRDKFFALLLMTLKNNIKVNRKNGMR